MKFVSWCLFIESKQLELEVVFSHREPFCKPKQMEINNDHELLTCLKRLGFSVYKDDVTVFKKMMEQSNCTIDDLKRATPEQIKELKRYYVETLEKLNRSTIPIVEFL